MADAIQSIVEVTQADRDAAADAMDAGYISPAGVIAHVRAGRSDENAFVLAFARHRIAEREACAKVAGDDRPIVDDAGGNVGAAFARKRIAAAILARSDRVE